MILAASIVATAVNIFSKEVIYKTTKAVNIA